MAEAKQRSEWNQTSSLLSMLFNAHRDSKSTQPTKPADFNPFEMKKIPQLAEGDKSGFMALRAAFAPSSLIKTT